MFIASHYLITVIPMENYILFALVTFLECNIIIILKGTGLFKVDS